MIVETKYGKLRGVQKQGYSVFRGVPFAKPPVGELRFKAPLEPDAWDGVRDAKVFGNRSMQGGQQAGSFYGKEFFTDEDFMPEMSEDSLYLNIWTPFENSDAKLPVAFWIHGGAFLGGFGTEIEFDGEEYCKRGVILVTVNYRLGAFGFLAHPWLTAEAGHSGNYGIMDQIAALKWVRDNIAAFGGDPEQITVYGQSAGSMSVQTILNSPPAKGMVSKAILQSAGGYNTGINRDITQAAMEATGERFVELSGVKTLDALRTLTAEEIQNVTNILLGESFGAGKGLPFAPCLDNYILYHEYGLAAETGIHPDIPYMIGSTKNDIGVTPDLLEKGEKSALYNGCIGWSHINEQLGRSPAYVYYFTRQLLGDEAGAFHSSELWYMFGTLHRSWRPKTTEDYNLSCQMMDYWCNFIKTGNPNNDGLPEWEKCSKDNPFVMEFNAFTP
jgi:para-nitrobenzyl esterase